MQLWTTRTYLWKRQAYLNFSKHKFMMACHLQLHPFSHEFFLNTDSNFPRWTRWKQLKQATIFRARSSLRQMSCLLPTIKSTIHFPNWIVFIYSQNFWCYLILTTVTLKRVKRHISWYFVQSKLKGQNCN